MRRPAAYTLVELLIGLAILALLLTAAVHWAVGNIRTYQHTSSMLERVQLEATARNVVVQELSFAGYGRGFIGELGGPTIEIGLSGREDRSDTFRVHYLEERWLSEPVVRDITLDVMRDAAGESNLYRREQGATRQPAVQDVTNLKLLGLVSPQGDYIAVSEPWPEQVSAFLVQLSFAWDTSRVAYIGFAAPQRLGRL